MIFDAIEDAVLKLPLAERGRLSAALLSSLEPCDPADVERAWIEEADRRYRAYRAGRSGAVPAQEAIAAARAALGRCRPPGK
jgi:hypothetical protein